ncbi:response regulator [Paenibacillus sp. S150]|uniref:response regulator n=1 Tax=Paenibacillus sp. S150 TaxID=2749826 RepID=UPI001C59D5F4|nr:response regulator [Paenibacillus sp. S150]MBW4081546.1 response regulator [Paenibacillus sp. S150]
MTLKMIIADDEDNVREGLRDIVPWEELNVEIAAVAADGQEALELCRKLKPDILLTDIRMPMMDGLETAMKLKELHEQVRIIIISGVQDFNYVKTALHLHADGYILKPIKIPELQDTVNKVVASITMERNRDEHEQRLKQQLQENLPTLREKFLANLLQGMYKSEQEVRDKLAFFELPLEMTGSWRVAVFQIDHYDKAIERYNEEYKQLLSFSIFNIMEEIAGRSGNSVTFVMNENEFVVISSQAAMDSHQLLDLCQTIIDCINRFLKIDISVGIGNPVTDILELYHTYYEACSAIEYKFFTGKNSVLQISDFKTERAGWEFPLVYEEQAKLFNYMKMGQQEEVAGKLNGIFELVCSNRSTPVGYVQSICIELINLASKTVFELGQNLDLIIDDFPSMFSEVYSKRDVSGLRETMHEFFSKLTGFFALKHNQKNSHMINKIKDIIAKGYMENLTVARLSEEVYLSPNYISLIFKQETGENITEYITKVRMDAAKELLKDLDLKILEVAEMVGYENATYFSTVFKKYAGMHPQKYRSLLTSTDK